MDIKQRDYTVPITSDTRKRHIHYRWRKSILSFMVQLEILVEDIWYPVVRYDSAHGFAHRDIMHYKGQINKQQLFVRDYKEALQIAEDDLRLNWQLYRSRFLKEVSDYEKRRFRR